MIDELLRYIQAKSVVPVIGPELALVEYEGRREPYVRVLARQLATRLSLNISDEPPTLDLVVNEYMASPGSRRQLIYAELGQISANLKVEIPEPFLQLAAIHDLKLFVSFCTDNLLAQALNQVRFDGRPGTHEIAFRPDKKSELPDDWPDTTHVYGLFGQINMFPQYVAAEEDQLEYITALQNPEKRPARLFDALREKHLLFLGCSFPDWLTRFILRTTKNDKLSKERDYFEYLVDDQIHATPLVLFLNSFSRGTQVLAKDPVPFVAELSTRWQQTQISHERRQPELAYLPDKPQKGCLFISFSSEDREAVLRLAAALQAAGLPVWLDKEQLGWGSKINVDIEHAILGSAVFLPVLSKSTENRISYYRKEWNQALERNTFFTGSSLSYLFPLTIDDVSAINSTEIPGEFKSARIESAVGGQLQAHQLERIAHAWQRNCNRLGLAS